MREYYPVVLIPLAFRQSTIYLPEPEYSKPIPPKRPIQPTQPKEISKPKFIKFIWFLILFLISLILTIVFGLLFKNIWLTFFVLVGTFISTSIYYVINQKRNYKERLFEYEQNQRELKLYPKMLAKWENNQQQYLQESIEYERRLELYNTQEVKLNSKIVEAKKILSQIKTTEPFYNENESKGLSENSFYSYLIRYFPDKIHRDLALQKEGYSWPYNPDFIYYDSDSSIYIDIEIDEPYDKKYKEPRHYIGLKKEQVRNYFFLKNNWIIIRFAEEQVVKFPDSCCKKIAEIISIFIPLSLPEELKSVDSLRNMPCWNYETAKKMARDCYRDKYL